MSAARDLANFLTGITVADLSPQTLDQAAMQIASTIVGRKSRRLIGDPPEHRAVLPGRTDQHSTGSKMTKVEAHFRLHLLETGSIATSA
jgi:hypothetical protein